VNPTPKRPCVVDLLPFPSRSEKKTSRLQMQKKIPTHEVKTKQRGPETHRTFGGDRASGLDLTATQKRTYKEPQDTWDLSIFGIRPENGISGLPKCRLYLLLINQPMANLQI
jgi:hypothetical protein